jgi:hypothetical protein
VRERFGICKIAALRATRPPTTDAEVSRSLGRTGASARVAERSRGFGHVWAWAAPLAALGAILGAFALSGTASATRCCYLYVGTTSQHNLQFDLNLRLNSDGKTWQLSANWRDDFSPATCANAFLFSPATYVIAPTFSFTFGKPVTVAVGMNPYSGRRLPGHKVTGFTVLFIKGGKITGSFTDTFPFKGASCTTGRVTFSAQRT